MDGHDEWSAKLGEARGCLPSKRDTCSASFVLSSGVQAPMLELDMGGSVRTQDTGREGKNSPCTFTCCLNLILDRERK